jgi:NADH-quinone oxidoreductase subunit F
VKRLNIAIAQAREAGLLGHNILGSGYSLDIEVYQGAGAFVCGEETALMNSIEGKRGMPRPRPPFPAVSGLWGKPSVLNNVETFANVPQIILNGGAWYASIGTEKSKGTKVFALTGAVNNVGLVEVPMGTSIGDIIFDIGGGIKKGRTFKAAQLGGPSGGCIPANKLNTLTDYEEIAKQGAIMGSGGLIVMDDATCMVDTARFFMEFCVEESCGKCAPCREGTKRMLEILRRICGGKGREGDIELLEELALTIRDSSLCGLGQTAPNPVLSTIRYFRQEYEAHIRDKKCGASVCSAMFKSPCQHACPVGMDIPAYMALVKANRLTDAMILMKRTNPFLGVCGRVCPQFCTARCRRAQLDEPMAIAWLKRYVADYAIRPEIKRIAVTRKDKIAVIGAGPAGLTIAQDLCMRGYAVTVFEELPEAGGMLRYAIPEYRMPREIVDQEVADIAQLGVEIRTGVRVGRDIGFDDLKRDYRVTVIAVGATKNWTLGIPGENLSGVWSAVDFLREHNLGKKFPLGPRVGIIGGGNSAIDAARVAIRMGATDVTVYYRRERKDMPAFSYEIHAAETEGVKFEYMVAPTLLEGSDGKLTHMTCQRMRAGNFDDSGRRRPVPIEGSTFNVEVDALVAAISQSSDLTFLTAASKVEVDKGGAIKSFGARTTSDGVFVAGDVCLGPATVVEAIAFAQKAAIDIDNYIRTANGEPPYVMPRQEVIQVPQEMAEEVTETPRIPMPELPLLDRLRGFQEVELGYSPEMAAREAGRCLRCDVKL